MGLQNPASDFLLEQGAAMAAEGGAVMLYDNLYALGQIFQLFLQDTSERLEPGGGALANGDAACAGGDVTLGSRLLEWLDRRNVVLDIAHKTALLQMANACEALTSPYKDFQPLTMS